MIVERSEVKRSEAIFFGNVNKAWIFVDDFLHSTKDIKHSHVIMTLHLQGNWPLRRMTSEQRLLLVTQAFLTTPTEVTQRVISFNLTS